MTYREAMLLLINKTPRAVEAAKVLRAIDSGSEQASSRAAKLIRVAVDEASDLTDADRSALLELLPTPPEAQRRTETVRFRCTPNERAALELLAEKYAGGNMSRLILDALQRAYPTV